MSVAKRTAVQSGTAAPLQPVQWQQGAGGEVQANFSARPALEIIVVRDPDAASEIHVFLDGDRIDCYSLTSVDPGAGYTRSEWLSLKLEQQSTATPVAAERIGELFAAYVNHEHIDQSQTSTCLRCHQCIVPALGADGWWDRHGEIVCPATQSNLGGGANGGRSHGDGTGGGGGGHAAQQDHENWQDLENLVRAIHQAFPTTARFGLTSSDQNSYGYDLVSVTFWWPSQDSPTCTIGAGDDRFDALEEALQDELGDLDWGIFGDGDQNSTFEVDITTRRMHV